MLWLMFSYRLETDTSAVYIPVATEARKGEEGKRGEISHYFILTWSKLKESQTRLVMYVSPNHKYVQIVHFFNFMFKYVQFPILVWLGLGPKTTLRRKRWCFGLKYLDIFFISSASILTNAGTPSKTMVSPLAVVLPSYIIFWHLSAHLHAMWTCDDYKL